MSRCDGCGGEDCACCEVFIEEQQDIRYCMAYGDDDYEHVSWDDDEELYFDTETEEYLTRDDLIAEYNRLYAEGNTEAVSFEEYLSNCLDKNGTLERL